jgi:hypothetical protein
MVCLREKIIPYAIRRLDYHDFECYCQNIEIKNINEVLMVCDKENIGSAKSIINNGGLLENEVVIDNVVE